MNKTEVLGAFLLANIPEIITQEEFDDVKKAIKKLQQENQELKSKIKTYEDPEDLTLMFMYCDEKAKDKIQELEGQLKIKHDGFMASVDEACDLAEEIQKYKEVIDKINVFLDNHDKNAGKLYYKYDNKYLLSEIKEDIRDILKEVE